MLKSADLPSQDFRLVDQVLYSKRLDFFFFRLFEYLQGYQASGIKDVSQCGLVIDLRARPSLKSLMRTAYQPDMSMMNASA